MAYQEYKSGKGKAGSESSRILAMMAPWQRDMLVRHGHNSIVGIDSTHGVVDQKVIRPLVDVMLIIVNDSAHFPPGLNGYMPSNGLVLL